MPERDQWSKNFSEWFHRVIFEIPIYDTRYPVKGTGIWMPYGFKIRQKTIEIIREELIKRGHEEVLFPTLIPEYMIRKEGEHIRSFEDQVFWITYGGASLLDVKLALRPTSETSIYPMFQLWIKSYSDLPLKIFQIVNVFRYETKATKPMIRVREISTFKEAHTAHATKEEAEKQIKEGIEIYKIFFEKLGIPYVISIRPSWDKFPGAEYSIAFDTIMPDGKVLQIGTIHFLGQNFAKAFDIKYMNIDGNYDYVWQTCYGISERVIAALISIHGDDHGLILPSIIAPFQVVIIPIIYKGKEDALNICKEIKEILEKANLRVYLDDEKEETPGSKYFKWELRGVPIRVEIGPKDVEKKTIVLVRRDTLQKITINRDLINEEIRKLLEEIDISLKERARNWFNKHISREYDLNKVKDLLSERGGIIEIPWCGRDICGQDIENKIDARILGIPYELNEKPSGLCANCSLPAINWIRIARSY